MKSVVQRFLKCPILFNELIEQKNKVRDEDVIERFLDVEHIREVEANLGPNDLNVYCKSDFLT